MDQATLSCWAQPAAQGIHLWRGVWPGLHHGGHLQWQRIRPRRGIAAQSSQGLRTNRHRAIFLFMKFFVGQSTWSILTVLYWIHVLTVNLQNVLCAGCAGRLQTCVANVFLCAGCAGRLQRHGVCLRTNGMREELLDAGHPRPAQPEGHHTEVIRAHFRGNGFNSSTVQQGKGLFCILSFETPKALLVHMLVVSS